MNSKNNFSPFIRNFIFPACTVMILVVPPGLFAQTQHRNDSLRTIQRLIQREMIDNAFIPLSLANRQTSPAYQISSPTFWAVQVNVSDSGKNIRGDAANEPSIAIDPNNPMRMVIGWRQFDTIKSNFRQAGFAYSTNRGQTWRFPGEIDRGVFRSDPVLGFDDDGNFYYNSLTLVGPDYNCHVFKSSDGGATWGPKVFAHGGDKQWMAIDRTSGTGRGNIYSFWTAYYSSCKPAQFTRSADRGLSYEDCTDIISQPYYGTLTVGPLGELYVFGVSDSDFVVEKSMSAQISTQFVDWKTSTPVSLDGSIYGFNWNTSPNPEGLLGQSWIATDHSNNSSRGNVYVLASVKRHSVTDSLDVMFARSTDGGVTWSKPVRVNDDSSKSAWHWFGTMSVAPNGRIDAIWLDTRDNPGTVLSSLYYSYSIDAGISWSRNQRLSPAFNPHVGWPRQNKMGDYFDMISDSTGANIAWAGTFNGEEDVYFGRINNPVMVKVQEEVDAIPKGFYLRQNYPNPFSDYTTISFNLPASSHVKLTMFDVLGREVKALLDEQRESGNHELRFDAMNLRNGSYFIRLEAGRSMAQRMMVVLK